MVLYCMSAGGESDIHSVWLMSLVESTKVAREHLQPPASIYTWVLNSTSKKTATHGTEFPSVYLTEKGKRETVSA